MSTQQIEPKADFLLHEKQSDEKGRRRTFAAIKTGKQGMTMTIGISTCGPRDTFVKSRGRQIAIGRAMKNPVMKVRIRQGQNPRDVFYRAIGKL